MSAINEAVEAVIGLTQNVPTFARVTRGAMTTGNCITCEIGPSSPSEVYLDKDAYLPLRIVINAKHTDLWVLSESLNAVHKALTTAREYPAGNDWHIVDISNSVMPQIIGRETDNRWFMSSALTVNLYLGE